MDACRPQQARAGVYARTPSNPARKKAVADADEDEAPGAKHALLSRWAKRRQEATGNEPTLWLVALAPPLSLHQYRLHAQMKSYALCAAQDKACIDQSNIQQSLACLPVFLAGCQTLLVVAGPTYCSRLWCVMELFAFVRSDCLLSSNPANMAPGP